MTGTLRTAQLLVERGALIESTDENGNTPLHGAAKAGNLPVVAYLIERKARIAQRNREGRTAYDLALEREHADIAALLRPR
jgi:ankyrin repeat protein